MNGSELTHLVEEAANTKLDAGGSISKPWLAQEIVNAQEPPEGESADFYIACAYHAVSDIIGRFIRRMKDSPGAEQLVLPGYKHLQRRYAIDRDGPAIVPLEEMTVDEMLKKANELDAFAEGAREHAEELRAYARAQGISAAE